MPYVIDKRIFVNDDRCYQVEKGNSYFYYIDVVEEEINNLIVNVNSDKKYKEIYDTFSPILNKEGNFEYELLHFFDNKKIILKKIKEPLLIYTCFKLN